MELLVFLGVFILIGFGGLIYALREIRRIERQEPGCEF